MSRDLPARPNLEHLKNQAKNLLHDFRKGDRKAVERLRSLASISSPDQPKLSDTQHAIAREYGFASWAKLKEHVESLAQPSDPTEALKAAVIASDARRVAKVLEHHPELKSKLNDPLPNYSFGEPPLFAAVQRSNREMIDILLRAGADINARTDWWAGSFGVLDDAARPDRDPGLATFLIKRGAVVDVHAAAHLGMLEKLKELVSANPELVNARGGDGQTPLHFAPTIETAQYLLDHGADINARDIDHESTPAQYMARDRQDVARYLITRGCRTDILIAAALGDLELVRRHLDTDPACIRMSVSEEYFPKQDSRAGGTIYIWTLGAHKTAHVVAREFGHEEVFRLLMERSSTELKLALACELGDEPTFKALLANRPNLAQTLSDDDRRKLAYAAQANNTEAVRLMLEAGWPVDARGQHGATPLHWAAFHGNAEMVREILRYKPPLEVWDENFDGKPLPWAIYGSVHGWHKETGDYGATVEALLQAGAEAPKPTDELEASESVRAVLRQYAERK
jgi:ankyrin repeat protein